MKILLLNPPYNRVLYQQNKPISVQPPIGLAYLASSLQANNINVKILDANALHLTLPETVEKIIASKPDIIGITATTPVIPLVYSIANEVKKLNQGIKIIVGGPHVTFLDTQTLKECPAIDIIIRGESELTIVNLIKNINAIERVNGITYRQENNIIKNPDQELIKNLDTIPFPAYDLLPRKKYKPGPFLNIGLRSQKFARIMSSRGCPNRCTYCSSAHFWKILRLRSPENIIQEITYLKNKYGFKHFNFLDDTFTITKERVTTICQKLLANDLKIHWTCFARVNTLDFETLKIMKKAGCFGIAYGIESGDEKILARIKKNINLDQARKIIKLTKKLGIKTEAYFMIGLPGETEETIKKTIGLAVEISPDFAFFSITTPFPGTEMYDELKKQNLIKDTDWQNYGLHSRFVLRTNNLTPEQLNRYYHQAIKKFYLRPKYIFDVIKRIITHPKEIKGYFQGLLAFINVS